jgi:hypothetical protein
MQKYLTEEQMKLVDTVCDKYTVEFKAWMERSESQLKLWYIENPNYDLIESAMRFVHYCADRFMKFRSVMSMMG